MVYVFLAALAYAVIASYEQSGDIREFYAGVLGAIGLALAFYSKPGKIVLRPIGIILIAIFVRVHFQIAPTSLSGQQLSNHASTLVIAGCGLFLLFLGVTTLTGKKRGRTMSRREESDSPARPDVVRELHDSVDINQGLFSALLDSERLKLVAEVTKSKEAITADVARMRLVNSKTALTITEHTVGLAEAQAKLQVLPSVTNARIAALQEAERRKISPESYDTHTLEELRVTILERTRLLERDIEKRREEEQAHLKLDVAKQYGNRISLETLDLHRRILELHADLERIGKDTSISDELRAKQLEVTSATLDALREQFDAKLGRVPERA